jgi:hypothetical protein
MNAPNFRNPVAARIDSDLRLRRWFERAGLRATALALGSLLDRHGVDQAALDELLALDPRLIHAAGPGRFPPHRLAVVPGWQR